MPAPIEFWFDFTSPYGYVASERIEALAARHGRAVRWHLEDRVLRYGNRTVVFA